MFVAPASSSISAWVNICSPRARVTLPSIALMRSGAPSLQTRFIVYQVSMSAGWSCHGPALPRSFEGTSFIAKLSSRGARLRRSSRIVQRSAVRSLMSSCAVGSRARMTPAIACAEG